MRRNAAEKIFVDILSGVPNIRENGIIHSDEYFEVMIADANLPSNEKTDILINIRQASKDEVEKLEKEHYKVAQEVAVFENSPSLVDETILKKQRDAFRAQIFWTFIALFTLALIIILLGFVFDNISKTGLLIGVVASCFGALILARSLSNKADTYRNASELFLDCLEEKKQNLANIAADILSLERLVSFIDATLCSNKSKDELGDSEDTQSMDDLK